MKKILNIGCKNDTFGTDFIDIYPTRKEVVKCDVDRERMPYPDRNFDLVYSKNLIEHVTNPLRVLKEMKRVLKRNGKLYILTDNAGFLLFHLPLTKIHFMQHNDNAIRLGSKDRHYFLFTPLHLRNLLEKCGGFKNVKTRYHYIIKNPICLPLQPFLNLLSKTAFRRISNPYIILTAYKK